MVVVNVSNGNTIATALEEAYHFTKRLRGLMFTKQLHSGAGIHLKPCQSVHTFFMNYAIDILYVNDRNEVVAIDEALKPRRVGKVYRGVASVVELPKGTVKSTQTEIGHLLKFIS
ncbi:DUF192 domain-containing protein [Evansella sp. AB-P1]|uniref:DUF192 domain-containing protein n=1 Tax=Evansella sp. AB-P1 TaxID=3037653 RepID=UPI00241F1BB9|nr:DUF192 domain-containing protein [Evansella sp. AB-P1]MDG5790055.1 DUF192 domain-containing protein [Evansella sp. AB-P1]